MIIFRYLSRELLANTFAVCTVLMLVLLSGRFVRYLGQAVAGDLEPGVIFAILGYRIPDFIQMTLPLAFFMAVMLTFGRLYVESEMSVLRSCGISERRLLGYTLVVGTGIALLVAWLSFVVAPSGTAKYLELYTAQQQKSELDQLSAQRFYSLDKGSLVAYVGAVEEDRALRELFMAMFRPAVDSSGRALQSLVLVRAERGQQLRDSASGDDYLVLENGVRVEGQPGSREFRLTQFEQYGTRLESDQRSERRPDIDALSSAELLNQPPSSLRDEYRATWYWRLALPLLVLVVALLAVPLARTDPRKGRFGRLLPAIILYFIYLVALNAVRGSAASGGLSPLWGFALVHGLFVALALLLFFIGRLQLSRLPKRPLWLGGQR
ncbi:LPS export ABC transporter permease LptF [Gammaproteobacteria bacterium LSUCC0057]|uniref:Lipopolysaccharide export system permease protein LptF n=1 Tax=Gammaproteobacteria bacterium LSUCC0057 TaxID=2559237 RepID=A0A4Y8UIJ6_9GAMM|nr:LPS export ABC transporter permease LptF [Gammaproteobacteria bacterium LSUCC0057]